MEKFTIALNLVLWLAFPVLAIISYLIHKNLNTRSSMILFLGFLILVASSFAYIVLPTDYSEVGGWTEDGSYQVTESETSIGYVLGPILSCAGIITVTVGLALLAAQVKRGEVVRRAV